MTPDDQPAATACLSALGDLLAAAPLLAGLGADALAEVAAIAQPFAFEPGARLFAQNDAADGVYLIGSGEVSVIGRTPGDGHLRLAAVGPGGVIGEFCLLDGGRRSAEARADSATQGYRIDFEQFAVLRAGARPVAHAILHNLRAQVARATRSTIAQIAQLAGFSPVTSNAAALAPGGQPADDAAALLHSFPGFSQFRPADWAAFSQAATRLELARGQLLQPPGSAANALYIVARGALRTALPGSGLGTQLLVHGPGALAGAAALVDGGDWPALIAAREDAVVFALPAPMLLGSGPPEGALEAALRDLLGRQLTTDLRRIGRARNRLDIQLLAPEGLR